MQVGVNYPWFDYGWDFGLGPPSWRGARTTPRWYDAIDGHLSHLQSLGITVVRWFILADGLTYGVGDSAPTPDPVKRGQWRFSPPPLAQEVPEHFEHLLSRFAAARTGRSPAIQLLPVLIDFHFCEPGTLALQPVDPVTSADDVAWVKQGRADALIDARKRARFLTEVLDPLLDVSRRTPEVIYAWEIINEPDWITAGWHPSPLARTPIPLEAMRDFLEEGKQRIRAAGFRPTIGFGSMQTYRRSTITAEINQFHHYPGGRRRLERHTFNPMFPGILGEFATADTDVWPDLPSEEQTVLRRLRLAEEQGYPLAIPWSFLARDRHTSWSPDVEAAISTFTLGVPSTTLGVQVIDAGAPVTAKPRKRRRVSATAKKARSKRKKKRESRAPRRRAKNG